MSTARHTLLFPRKRGGGAAIRKLGMRARGGGRAKNEKRRASLREAALLRVLYTPTYFPRLYPPTHNGENCFVVRLRGEEKALIAKRGAGAPMRSERGRSGGGKHPHHRVVGGAAHVPPPLS